MSAYSLRPTPARLTIAEWKAEGKRRFGENTDEWKFVCPACGHVARVIDFKPYADKGANPDSAYQECIGRYTDAGAPEKGKQPCNWAAYGLFRISGHDVELEDGSITPVFAFAAPEPQGGDA